MKVETIFSFIVKLNFHPLLFWLVLNISAEPSYSLETDKDVYDAANAQVNVSIRKMRQVMALVLWLIFVEFLLFENMSRCFPVLVYLVRQVSDA